jgi:hypothetical protein
MGGQAKSWLPFVVQAAGCFGPGRVLVKYVSAPRPTTTILEGLIAKEWKRRTAEAGAKGRVLFNGELLRYVGHEVRGGETFELTVGPTCYRDFVGTNLYNHQRVAEFGWQCFANPVGTTATLVSKDGLICYGRRSEQVAYHQGHVHTFGGALEEEDRRADGEVDAFVSLRRELKEELNLEGAEVEDLCCVGLIRDTEILQPELLFEGRLRLTAEELQGRWRRAEARAEHEGLVTLSDQAEAIVPFIRGCGPIAPVAVGALFLHGRRRWGEEWFRRAAGELRM